MIASKPGYTDGQPTGSTVLVPGGTALATIALPAHSSTVTGCIYVPSPTGGTADSVTGVTATLSGTAFNGTPYSKAGVLTAALTATCGVANAAVYTFSAVPDGNYTVALARSSYLVPAAPSVTVSGANANASPFLVRLQRGTGSIAGTVSFSSAAFSPGVSFNVARAQAGAVVTVDGAELAGGHLVTTTDASGAFSLGNIPANVNGQYTVTVAQNHFGPSIAGSDTALVTVPSSTTATAVTGLSLTVKVATMQANALFRDYGACATPAPTTVGACAVSRCAADTFANGVSINLSGTAFTGDAINPNAVLTNSSGSAVFSVPAGSYSVSSAPAGRTPDTQFPAGLDAATSCSTLVFQDRIAPTTPVLGTSVRSPTSRASAPLQLIQASTDATLPSSNFKGYQVRVCSPACGPGGWAAWDGIAVNAPALVNGVDNNIFVYAEDFAGNQSGTSVITVHRESTPPPQPLNVHADNRNGSARITWDPVVSNTSVGISGYLVYYGPIYSSNYADYTGNFVSQGPSPIRTQTPEITLTGLPNASSFFVTVAATDQVVDPSPNVSQLSFGVPSAVKVNPNVAPLDRAVHLAQSPYTAPSYFNSIAVFGDRAFVSQGSPPAAGPPSCSNRGNLPPFSIRTYSYEKYGGSGLVDQSALIPLSSLRARQLVADDNRTLFGFDPGLFGVATVNNGIDVIDAANPLAPVLLQQGVFPTYRVQQLAPVRRADVGGAGKSHAVFTYLDTADGNYKIGTFAYGADHVSIGACDASCGTLLHTNSAPLDLKVVGPWVFVTHQSGNVDGYTIAATFGSIAYNTSAGTSPGTFGFNALVVDWPRVYFGGTPGSTGGLFESTVTSTAPLTLSAATQVATLHSPAMKMAVAGDLLLVGEQLGYGGTAIEAFSLANPDAPVLAGTYETDQPSSVELSTIGNIYDMVVSGANVFTVLGNDRSCYGTANLDVVEMGNPHSVSRLATVFPDNLNGEVGAIRGSRALVTVSQGSSFELISADLHAGFAGFGASSFTKTSFQIPNASLSCAETPASGLSRCAPMAQAGDGVWVFSGTATVPNQLALYDASTPTMLSGAAAAATVPVVIRGTSTPVSGIAAANGYLVASLESSTDYVAVWDVSNPAAPVGPSLVTTPGANFGRGVRMQGRYAYVATRTGYCVVDVFASPIAEVGCTLAPDPSNCAGGGYTLGGLFVATDTNRMYLSVNPPYGACGSNVYAYDLTAPRTPALLPTSFTQLAIPTALLRSGPYLFAGQSYSSAFAGVVSYDLTQATPPLVGSLQATTHNQYAVGGSLLLIPDSSNGLQLVRTY